MTSMRSLESPPVWAVGATCTVRQLHLRDLLIHPQRSQGPGCRRNLLICSENFRFSELQGSKRYIHRTEPNTHRLRSKYSHNPIRPPFPLDDVQNQYSPSSPALYQAIGTNIRFSWPNPFLLTPRRFSSVCRLVLSRQLHGPCC